MYVKLKPIGVSLVVNNDIDTKLKLIFYVFIDFWSDTAKTI